MRQAVIWRHMKEPSEMCMYVWWGGGDSFVRNFSDGVCVRGVGNAAKSAPHSAALLFISHAFTRGFILWLV